MKQGRSLTEVAQEMARVKHAKVDLLAPTREIAMNEGRLIVTGNKGYDVRPHALRQIGTYTGIPAAYVDRMIEKAPELFDANVNHWLHAADERRMVRTLDGSVRAFLSDRYQRIDNYDVAEKILPVTAGRKLKLLSSEVTESKLYLKFSDPSITAKVDSVRGRKVGDIVEAGVIVSNSEIGSGALVVRPFANFLICLNGMIRDKGMRAAHVGKRHDVIDAEFYELSDETKRLEDMTVLSKAKDVVEQALDDASFRRFMDSLNDSTDKRIAGNPSKAVEVLADTFRFNETESAGIMRHLIEGGDLSKYGLVNAVTRTAEDVGSYDRATEIEAAGFRLLELAGKEWKEIAEAE